MFVIRRGFDYHGRLFFQARLTSFFFTRLFALCHEYHGTTNIPIYFVSEPYRGMNGHEASEVNLLLKMMGPHYTAISSSYSLSSDLILKHQWDERC